MEVSIFGVTDDGLIMWPTDVSTTSSAAPSEALRFFLAFFSALKLMYGSADGEQR